MSCIPKVLSIKGDKEVLKVPKNDGLLVEGGGHYNGYDFLITFNHMGFRCGYVAIPPEHPIYTCEDSYPDFEVNGGVTFFGKRHSLVDKLIDHPCEDKWIGFDCGHGGCDAIDVESFKKYFGEDAFLERMEYLSYLLDGTIKDYGYVEYQCKRLIDQLIEQAA